jgi:hypothetical protein
MSWHFSQALVEAYWAEHFLDGELFAEWKSIPSAPDDSCSDKMKDIFHVSPFGMMYVLSTDAHGAALLTWFLEDFLVRESPGESRRESFATWDRSSASWKTHQYSLLGGLESFWETWPKWGSMRNGECFHAPMRAAFTYENASGLRLPTPRACSAIGARITESTAAPHRFPNLETVLARLTLPTLGANEYKGAAKSRFLGSPDFHGAKMSEGLRICEDDPIYLNPSFAELVMMRPMGWTDSTPLETDKFREWLRSHGDF